MIKTRITLTLMLFALFLAYTCMCIMVDVSLFAPQNVYTGAGDYGTTEIGLYSLNTSVHSALGFKETLYKFSEYLGYFALMVGAVIGCLWLYRFIKTHHIPAVDPILNASVVTMALMAAFYVLFEVVKLNYRPAAYTG